VSYIKLVLDSYMALIKKDKDNERQEKFNKWVFLHASDTHKLLNHHYKVKKRSDSFIRYPFKILCFPLCYIRQDEQNNISFAYVLKDF
jgi:hypothetical protein